MMAPAEAQMAAVETNYDKHGARRVTLTPSDTTQPLYYVLVKESFYDNTTGISQAARAVLKFILFS